ncbi:hypothetical protein VaNZ11_009374, partial [Volvox africanus]
RACRMLNRTILRARVPFSGARLPGQPRPIFIATAITGGASISTSTKPNISDLAKMAQVGISEQEAADWAPKINSVLDWFGQLQSVDVKGVIPAIHACSESNRLRPDEASHYPARTQLLSQAPWTESSYVRVPKMAGGDGQAEGPVGTAPAKVSPVGADTPAASRQVAAASPAAAAGSTSGSGAPKDAIHALDIRVGRIVSCEQHPDAESLYVEKIDVGELEPRTIVSGLVKYVPLEAMQGRLVVVICNLKPRNMRGIKSFGMLLAASDEPHVVVEPLVPPPGARPGERVWFGEDSQQPAAADPKVVDKKKYWEAVQPLLRTNGDCVATLAVGPDGATAAMNTSSGSVRSASLTGARIA